VPIRCRFYLYAFLTGLIDCQGYIWITLLVPDEDLLVFVVFLFTANRFLGADCEVKQFELHNQYTMPDFEPCRVSAI
jgi:hypothetical protein